MSVTADQLLTAEQLAERWQMVSKGPKPGAAIYRLTREGVIPPGVVVRLGRKYRYRVEGVEAFEREGGLG
jgi:hypothetical protein